MSQVLKTWWPLAASWLLMAIEGPAVSAIIARLANPEIHLAAYGGLVFPLALFIEAPIIMLLAASTALSKDWESYRKLRNFMHAVSFFLTLVHVLVVFTPAYYVVARGLIGAPEEIIEPARLGLMIMTPWTWAIAYRRFNQGVLIRFGHSLAVGTGTLVRLVGNGTTLAIGYAVGSVSGITVAALATAIGVMSETIFVAIRVRPVVRKELAPLTQPKGSLSLRELLRFYVPLSLTPVIFLGVRPIGSAAISRMPDALESLAVWPVVTGLIFMLRSFGISYNEVVVALSDKQGSSRTLVRFATILTTISTVILLIIVGTPLARFWFGKVVALKPSLVSLASAGTWFALLLPGLSVFQSWFQGAILHSRKTRSITEAVGLFLIVNCIILGIGIVWGKVPGLFVGLASLSVGAGIRSGWLWWRSRSARIELHQRDKSAYAPQLAVSHKPIVAPSASEYSQQGSWRTLDNRNEKQ